MIVKEYGKNNKDVIILLHGGGLSWWNYREVSELLKDNYHIILPILDGHSESDKGFTTISNNADEIIKYVDDNFDGEVELIGGLSLGAQILLDILSKRNNICKYAIIESALVYPLKFTNKLIIPSIKITYGLISKRWFSKLQFNNLKIKESLFEDYYRDSSDISINNMINILKANSNYVINNLESIKTKAIVIVGSKERPIMIKSAKRIHDELVNSDLEILNGYHHGDLSINHPKEYASIIKKIAK